MKRIILACTALATFTSAVHATGLPVFDGAAAVNSIVSIGKQVESAAQQATMIENQIAQLVQLKATLEAVAHGNLAAVSDLVPQLSAMGVTNPFGEDTAGMMQSLSGLASAGSNLASQVSATSNMAQGLLSTDQLYAPTGSDFRANAINSMASAAAYQKAVAAQALDVSSKRLAALTDLRSQLSNTPDLKASADAGARWGAEQVLATEHGNQLLAIQISQRAQDLTDAQRELQAWRCSAEALVKEASGAASAAGGGAVTLVSAGSGASCTVAAAPATGTYASNGNTVGTLVSATGTSGDGTGDGATLGKMLAQPWGQTAANNATALGVNPAALAATCSLESNCTANPGGTGTISGAFQMSNGTYAQTVGEVQASNPGLASGITSKNDPASQSIASAQYLKDGAQSLQAAGISNPSVLDVRGYYQFGPASAATLASAPDNQVMSSTVNFSAATLAANGITPGVTTVGQWRSTVVNKIGAGTASQSVLIGANA
jgi:hypothetical protein